MFSRVGLCGLLAFCLFASMQPFCNAQQPKKNVAPRQADPAKIELPSGDAMKFVEDLKKKILKEKLDKQIPGKDADDEQQLKAIEMLGLASRMDFISKTLNLEEDTKIPRRWFQELHKLLEGFVKVKMSMENAVDNRDKQAYLLAGESFERGKKLLKEVLEKPPKLTADQLKKIKEENDILRMKIRAEAIASQRKG